MIESLIKQENKGRKAAINKLNSYLTNPGRFSILIIGHRGTGKTHWLKELQKVHEKSGFNLKSIFFLTALKANSFTEKKWEDLLNNNNKGLFVITDVEELTKESQSLLFEGISTGEGGKFGFKEKIFDLRIAFTTTKSISALRDTETYLTHKFFDRICQFAVKFPCYQRGDNNIWKDFKKTWKKMCFEKQNTLPGIELKEWLESTSIILHGNFRDLDKLAINWHNYRLQEGFKEENILNLVQSDFFNFYRFPEHNDDIKKTFEIDEDSNWYDNKDNFKAAYTKYLKEKHGTLRKGAKEAGVSYRTMERWSNGK